LTAHRGSVFIIAEAGSNWRMGSPSRDAAMARELVDAAKLAGADAVKFQTFRVRDLYVENAGPSEYLSAAGIRSSVNELLAELEMPYELVADIAAYAVAMDVEFMSTAFSPADVAAVDPHVKRHKVASYEVNHVELLEAVAATGKPIILSTGAATMDDIEFGLRMLREAGAADVTLMQCTASYPAPPDSLNLSAIPALREAFGVPVGLSDHSRDPVVGPVAAVALGAVCIEKHFTLDNRLPGPDHRFAITADELVDMVTAIRTAEAAMGTGIKRVLDAERELRDFAVRSIQARTDIQVGEALVRGENIDVLRPGKRRRGLHPGRMTELQGRKAARPISAGDGVTGEDVDPPL
jgi:sialic acid synthase SpsE